MSCENGVCSRKEDQGSCVVTDDEQRLFRWDPVKKGHVRELELEPGKKYKMITLASKPPIFELPDFLSGDESERIIDLAEMFGLENSYMHSDEFQEQHKKDVKGHAIGAAGIYLSWDKNQDKEITKDEVIHFSKKYKFLYMSLQEVDEMINKLKIKAFDDGKVTFQEFRKLPTAAMDDYMNKLKESSPIHRERNSNQTWLHQGKFADKVMQKLRARIKKLTKLSDRIIRGSEPLQVVKYDPTGHYNVHHDAQPIASHSHLKCCHQNVTKLPACRLCRYITILYYLNDVEEGGETAFPVADNETFDQMLYIKTMDEDKFNLMEFCHDGKLVVTPKRGKAIMWYNHFVDEETGWLGERDDYTLHGGCGVKKGFKWIANNWITAPDASLAHIRSNFEIKEEEGIVS